MTANLQNVNAMARLWRGVGAAMQQANGRCGGRCARPHAMSVLFDHRTPTGSQVSSARQKESAPPSPEAHKFHDIKPFNSGMGKQL
ncbi:hypothetical protein JYK21_13055 [Ralstonia pickettii]|nr:hypothetical protein [Ralstonia pickettii]